MRTCRNLRTGASKRLHRRPTYAPGLIGKRASGFGGGFSYFRFLISRLLRFCSLAIAESPFNKSGALTRRRYARQLETILSRHPLMTFVRSGYDIAANLLSAGAYR